MIKETGNLSTEMLRLRQLQSAEAAKPKTAPKPIAREPGPSFAEVLKEKISAPDVKFSAHAVSRLIDRGISLSKAEIDRLRAGVGRAAEKGANESLVLLEDMAFVVSIKNRTVITAMAGSSIKNNVFTNIDSAVIV